LLPEFFKEKGMGLYNKIFVVGRNLERAAKMSVALFLEHFVLNGEWMT